MKIDVYIYTSSGLFSKYLANISKYVCVCIQIDIDLFLSLHNLEV